MKNMSSKLIILFLVSLLIFGSLNVLASAQVKNPTRLSFGSASPGGSFYLGAVSLATVVNNTFDDVDVIVEITNATKHNIDLVQAGQIHLGMASSNVVWEAWNGKGTFEGKPAKNIRIMIPGWNGVNMLITLEKFGFNNILDFDGEPYNLGPRGGAAYLFSQRVFEVVGVNVQESNLQTEDAARALTDGIIKGFTIQWPATTIHQLEIDHELKIFTVGEQSMTKEQLEKFFEVYPEYSIVTIPKGYYKAIKEDMPSAGHFNTVICQKDLPEDLVYKIVKSIFENKEMIKQVYPAAANAITLDNLVYSRVESAPYHPGAVKYFREQGVDIPDNLIPPEMK